MVPAEARVVNAAVSFNARSATLSSGTQLRADARVSRAFNTGPLATQCGVEGLAPVERRVCRQFN